MSPRFEDPIDLGSEVTLEWFSSNNQGFEDPMPLGSQLSPFKDWLSTITRGQLFEDLMLPGSHISPHTKVGYLQQLGERGSYTIRVASRNSPLM